MRKKIVAGNWKMNTTPVEGVELAKEVVAGKGGVCSCVNFIIAPPFTHLSEVVKVTRGTALPSQPKTVRQRPKEHILAKYPPR